VDDVVEVSALSGDGLDDLRERVRDALPTETETLTLPNDGDGQATLSWLYDHASVDDVAYADDISVTVTARQTILDRARSKAASAT
jgi:50S ribosomal subunit-associated GTPase HflX